MKSQYLGVNYQIISDVNYSEGSATVKLILDGIGDENILGEIVFWDSMGQFFIKLIEKEIPLVIIEWFIDTAKKIIPLE